MKLIDVPAAKAFILHWGEMGTQWGFNRSVAQIHGLLYLSDRPMHAEDIVDQLGIARSNFSTAVRELQSYNIVRRIHVEDDRLTPPHVRERIVRMHEFIGTLGGWYDQVRLLPKSTLIALMKLGSKVARFIPSARPAAPKT